MFGMPRLEMSYLLMLFVSKLHLQKQLMGFRSGYMCLGGKEKTSKTFSRWGLTLRFNWHWESRTANVRASGVVLTPATSVPIRLTSKINKLVPSQRNPASNLSLMSGLVDGARSNELSLVLELCTCTLCLSWPRRG